MSHFQIKIYEGARVYGAWHLASFIMDVSLWANATQPGLEFGPHAALAESTQMESTHGFYTLVSCSISVLNQNPEGVITDISKIL